MLRLHVDRRPSVALGALLSLVGFLAPRALDAQGRDPVRMAIIGLMVLACGMALERTADLVLRVGRAPLLIRPLAAVALVDGALAISLATYVDWAIALVAIGALLAGIGLGACPRPRAGNWAVAGAVLVGAAFTVFAPVAVHTISSFAVTRHFEIALAATPAGKQFVAVVAALVVLWGVTPLFGPVSTIEEPAARASESTAAVETFKPTYEDNARAALLEVDHIELSYGSVPVLFGVSFTLNEGEALALLGTNGAGKSSVLRTVFGLVPPNAGAVRFRGQDITGERAESLVRRGLVQVPGGRAVFPSLTVRENLRAAGHAAGRQRITEGTERTLAVFPQLARSLDQPAGLLSGGEQQMLALGRAWITRPIVLAIDELTLGLAPVIVDDLVEIVQSLRKEGVSLVLIDQSIHVARRLCERAVFLERGAVRFDGPTTELADRSDLLRSMFFASSESSS